jgi:hypothetical protein
VFATARLLAVEMPRAALYFETDVLVLQKSLSRIQSLYGNQCRRGLRACIDVRMVQRGPSPQYSPPLRKTINASYWKISSRAVINGARCRISHSTNAQHSQEWIALGGIEKEDDKQPNILARGNPRSLGETSKTALAQPHTRPRACLADSARAGRTMRLAAEQPKIAHIRILARPEQDSRPLDRRDSGQWRCGGQARRRWAPITQIKQGS